MRRLILATCAVVVATSSVTPNVGAVGFDSTARYIKRGYHRNVAWPWPYICPDRAAVREPFDIMVQNGWRRQNLLGEHHFNQTADQLTTAGELKVHWAVTQAPPEFRNVYVERAMDPNVTAARVAAAREYASRVVTDGRTPNVADTHLISEGRPASVVDSINVRFGESQPPPVLPAATGGGFDSE